MPITRADLIAPIGEVEASFFPGEDQPSELDPTSTRFELRLDTYIAEAYAKTAELALPDKAARAWALYRTFDAAYMLKANAPASESLSDLGLGSQSYSADQRAAFFRKANQYLKEYETEVSRVNAAVVFPNSRAVQTVFDW